jgi:hypothetical protein
VWDGVGFKQASLQGRVAKMLDLTIEFLRQEARHISVLLSERKEPTLFGVTDGKAVGTHVEHALVTHLSERFTFERGNAAKGIDFPGLNVDVKVTSIAQPQSSCPFRSARQKIFGLGYALLLFVYDKHDDPIDRTGRLEILHTIFVDAHRTADFTITRLLREMLEHGANEEELVALMLDRHLPLDEIEATNIAKELLENPPEQGYLTISNALQWRLQYARAIKEAGSVAGLVRL